MIESTSDQILAELLPFFKALSDASRLRIIGLLANGELSVEQLAEKLNLRPSTISHHLSRLSEIGLVSARAESYYNYYRLENGALERMAQRLLQREDLPNLTVEENLDEFDRKVLHDFVLPDGRVKALPAQRKKLEAILRYIWRGFTPGQHYTEKQVNEIITRYHSDFASLRRELVDYHMLMRTDGGREYWVPDDTEAPARAG